VLLIERSPFLDEVKITCHFNGEDDDDSAFGESDVEDTDLYIWFVHLTDSLGINYSIKSQNQRDIDDFEDCY